MSNTEQTIADLRSVHEIVEQRAYEIGWDADLQSVHDATTTAIKSLERRSLHE